MGVNLQKGQKVDLTKGNAGLRGVMVGLGWDEVQQQQKSGGFFGSLFGGSSAPQQDIDCDASAFLIKNGRIEGLQDIVFYNNLRHASGTVLHQGDNLTGAGEGDDEQIFVNLQAVPQYYEKIVFVVTIYQARQRHQHFGLVRNCFIRLVDVDTNRELCRYNLSENYDNYTAMVFGEVYRHNGEWKFGAIGQPTQDNSVIEIAARFGLPVN